MIQKDKILHFIGGFAIAFVAGFIIHPAVGLAAASLAGVGKEYWDSRGHGTVDYVDALATILGGILGAAVVFLS